MDLLIQAMSLEDMVAAMEIFKDKPHMVATLKPAYEGKLAEIEASKAKDKLLGSLGKLLDKQPQIPSLTNVFIHWGKVSTIVGETEVDLVGEGGVVTKELRPIIEERESWIVEENKVFDLPKSPREPQSTVSKRSLTVWIIKNDQWERIGNFRTGHEGCAFLGYDEAGASAPAYLHSKGYTTTPYNGGDFTVPQ